MKSLYFYASLPIETGTRVTIHKFVPEERKLTLIGEKEYTSVEVDFGFEGELVPGTITELTGETDFDLLYSGIHTFGY